MIIYLEYIKYQNVTEEKHGVAIIKCNNIECSLNLLHILRLLPSWKNTIIS